MNNRPIPRRWRSFLADQDGATVVVIALLLPVFLGFAGLSVDVGHLYLVKTQLQNAADAGALAGARGLIPYTQSAGTYKPDWVNGTRKAQDAVGKNAADNLPLSVLTAAEYSAVPPPGALLSQATPCYWNVDTKTWSPTKDTPLDGDIAAIHVMVSKTTGQNDGPVPMILASVLGVLPADVSATAVAMVPLPRTMPAYSLFPMAILKSTIDDDSTIWYGAPFSLGADSGNGQWTTFNSSKSIIQILEDGGNDTPLNLGDDITIRTGVVAVNYARAKELYENKYTVIPLVADAHSPQAILGFLSFYIEYISATGDDKNVHGKLLPNDLITQATKITGQSLTPISNCTPPQLVY